MEPTPARAPLEVGIVVEVTCDDARGAETIAPHRGEEPLLRRLPDVKGTAGTAAIMSDEVLLHAAPGLRVDAQPRVEVMNPRELSAPGSRPSEPENRRPDHEARRARVDHPQQERRVTTSR